MKARELIAILDRREMGRFFRDMKGRVSFVYDEKWRNAADAYPLSLSMPLTLGEHGNSCRTQRCAKWFYGNLRVRAEATRFVTPSSLASWASSILTGRSLGRVQFLRRCGTTA
jgi:HipA-like protein